MENGRNRATRRNRGRAGALCALLAGLAATSAAGGADTLDAGLVPTPHPIAAPPSEDLKGAFITLASAFIGLVTVARRQLGAQERAAAGDPARRGADSLPAGS